jgi:serine/threonine protein kinase
MIRELNLLKEDKGGFLSKRPTMTCPDIPQPERAPTPAPLHAPGYEPIPGYRLIQLLGRGGFGEVWKCEVPGGLHKAIKFVEGSMENLLPSDPAGSELRAIERVKAIRHPFILSMERVEFVGRELVIVMELADMSLADVLGAQKLAGKSGIPREKLLAYLSEAAEALDVMHLRYELQHLDIKPQNLFLVSNHLKIGDFGLVNSLRNGPVDRPLPLHHLPITPNYVAPEIFQGIISPHTDQYSLAIVYQELLTGVLPFQGKNVRELMIKRAQGEADLRPLPEADRPIIARALSRDPQDRFPTCSDFIHALLAGQTEVITTTVPDDFFCTDRAEPEAAVRRETPASVSPEPATQAGRSSRIQRTPPRSRSGTTGYHFLELIAQTPLLEVWEAQAPDGSARLAKVMFGFRTRGSDGAARLAELRHPRLVPIDIIARDPGRLVLAHVPGERTLRSCLEECQAHGLPGVPRQRLLGYLRAAAEALDDLAEEAGLYHLGLNPRNLVLEGERLFLTDFGLAQLLWLPNGHAVAPLNARYSAPELFQKQVSPRCDQYSLALIYHEMLLGSLPSMNKATGRVNLDALPEPDRTVLARALAPDPQERWNDCFDFVEALKKHSTGTARKVSAAAAAGTERVVVEPTTASTGTPPPLRPVDGSRSSLNLTGSWRALEIRFCCNLTAEVISQRLEGFREQWKATLLSSDQQTLTYRMQTPRSLWQRWTGRQPGLDLRIHLASAAAIHSASGQTITEVRVEIQPHDCTREQSKDLVKMVGPMLVESVRTYLQNNQRGRSHERLAWHHPFQLCSINPDGSFGAPIDCQGKDISLTGIGFYLPGELPASDVLLYLPETSHTSQMTVPAHIVRAQSCGNGWFEAGAILLQSTGTSASLGELEVNASETIPDPGVGIPTESFEIRSPSS